MNKFEFLTYTDKPKIIADLHHHQWQFGTVYQFIQSSGSRGFFGSFKHIAKIGSDGSFKLCSPEQAQINYNKLIDCEFYDWTRKR